MQRCHDMFEMFVFQTPVPLDFVKAGNVVYVVNEHIHVHTQHCLQWLTYI